MGKPIQVRVTQEPGVVREVDSAEFTDLSRQGLLHSHNVEGVKSPRKWVDKKRGDEVVVPNDPITDPAAGSVNTKGASK